MLETIKLLLGLSQDDSQDALIQALISQCSTEYLDITKQTVVNEPIVIEMVVYHYNLQGTKGLSAESYTGTSYTYKTDYPETLYRKICAKRLLKVF